MDDRCETISHPMAYYEKALDEADEDDLVDWREENGDETAAEGD
jgi:DNA primase large subunit